MKFKFFTITFLTYTLNPLETIAQYNQYASYDSSNSGTGIVVQFGGAALLFLKFALGVVAVLAVLRIFIACIIYLTHAGDEDRNDTAWSWWKHSFAYLIIAQVIYFAVDKAGDYLNIT